MSASDTSQNGPVGVQFAGEFGAPAMAIDTANSAASILCVNESFKNEFDIAADDISEQPPHRLCEKYDGVPRITVDEYTAAEAGIDVDLVVVDSQSYIRCRMCDTDRDLIVDIYYRADDLPQRQHLKVLHRVLRHDLRNGITAIKGWAEVISNGDWDDQETLREAATHILNRVDDLENLSREAGEINQLVEIDSHQQRLELNDIVEAVITDCESRFNDPDIQADLPQEITILGNAKLHYALDNIVDNALRHNNTERVTVRIDASLHGNQVTLSISDTGKGIPPVEKNIITGVQPVDQLNHSDGLGLWLTKWILDRHDAQLEIEANNGEGTRFDITLPLVD